MLILFVDNIIKASLPEIETGPDLFDLGVTLTDTL